MYKIPNDVIVLPEKDGRWIIMNVFSKTCLGVDSTCFEFLRVMENSSMEYIDKISENKQWPIWDIEYFSNYEGLLADPTRYIRLVENWPEKKMLNIKELIKEFLKHFILIEDEKSYHDRFQNKKSLLDYEHFGNFHEQLGQHIMLVRREDPQQWWLKQKFNNDLSDVRNNLYHAIQTNFLEKYFQQKLYKGSTVLDIGCGVGFYSKMMAKNGVKVIGVDPNEKYVELAKKNNVNGAEFERVNVGSEGALDKFPTGSVDFVFMSDALLFYFVSPKKDQMANLDALLSDIRRILKPDGLFISVEPHYIFWLLPWLGDIKNPYTILTEYNCKKFGVTATMSQLMQAFCKNKFVISWIEELKPDSSFESVDPRAYYFANQFPLWQLFELKPMKG